MKNFRYTPLEWQDDIRLLRIIDVDENDEDPIHSQPFQPSTSTESWSSKPDTSNQLLDQDVQDRVDLKVLKLELVHMSTAVPKSYKALSYAWGDSTVTKEVIINNRKSRITASLHSALFNLHVGVLASEEESTYIWADAICIDQKNNEEKMHQVQQMKRIYENSTEVIVWLGAGNWWRYLGIQELERVAKACELEYAWGTDPYALTATEFSELLAILSEGWNLNKERAMQEVFDCPWFGRAWVQQEVAVGSSVVVVCGRRRISFERLAVAVNAYALLSGAHDFQWGSHSTWLGAGFGQFRQAIRYDTLRHGSPTNPERLETVYCTLANRLRYQDSEQKKRLIDHLMDNDLGGFGQLHATDCRDFVYAFLGISIDTERLDIEPRYDLKWPSVFTDVTYKLIQQEGPGLLTLCGCRDRRRWNPHREYPPSWVLDIRNLPIHTSINKRIWQMKIFNASLNSNFVYERCDSGDIPILDIYGVVVDTIKEVGGDMGDNFTTVPFFNQIGKFLAKSRIYTAKEKMIAFQRIPINDMERRGKKIYEQITSTSSHGQRQFRSSLLKLKKGGILRKYSKSTLRELIRGMSHPFVSSKGYVGLGPPGAQPGDMICIIYGLGVPMLLRNNGVGEEDTCVLVGEMYVHGIMDGEFMHIERERRKFRLV